MIVLIDLFPQKRSRKLQEQNFSKIYQPVWSVLTSSKNSNFFVKFVPLIFNEWRDIKRIGEKETQRKKKE